MDFRILGPLEVTQDGRALALGGAKQRALLAILLLHPNRVVSVDRLIDLLWGEEPPDTAPNTLQVYVSGLRKALEPGRAPGSPSSLLVRRAPGYALEIAPDDLDASRFERMVASASGLDDGARAARLREALGLWRGPALADFSYEPFAQAEAGRLEELRMEAIEARIEAELGLGRHRALVGELEVLVAEHPLREALRAHHMLALYRSGRQAEALAVYAETRRVLDEELGIDPSARLQQLEQKMLLQDPSLEAPAPPAAAQPPVAVTAGTPPRAPGRKVVSVVCCELDSGDDGLDPEARGEVVARLQEVVRAAFERHGAISEMSPDDQIVGVFGVPVVHEDDALRAARAAVEARDALRDGPLQMPGAPGFGIATGEVLALGSGLPRGEVFKAAAELARMAESEDILLAGETRRHIGPAARTESVGTASSSRRALATVWRLVDSVRPVSDTGRRLNAPMVGRARELAALTQAYERTLSERSCYLFSLLGAAGVGKSRLLAELVRSLAGRAEVFSARCPPYGEGVTFLPARDIVRQAAGLDEDVDPEDGTARIGSLLEGQRDAELAAQRIAEVAGLAPRSGSLEEVSWAVRKLLEAVGRRRPAIVVVDDVHWAEPAMLDLVEHVADWSRGVPLLLVCSARPEFLDTRPSWGGGKLNASSMLLEPLSEDESHLLLRNLLGRDSAPDIGDRIVSAAEGNPLFVEEMTRMLIDDGYLRSEGDQWVATSDLSRVSVPPTIYALIAARLDRLEGGERALLGRAAVVGKDFSRDALEELCESGSAGLLRGLMGLVRKELIRPELSGRPDEEAYRFRHILIRETAYGQIPKDERARLHERVAAWLERTQASPEIVAFHLERAFLLHRDLRRSGPDVDELGRRATGLLARAARAAATHGDFLAAAGMLERALALVDPAEERRSWLLLDLSDALADLGELRRAEGALQELLERASGDGIVQARARILLWTIRSSSENVKGWRDQAWPDLRGAMTVFERQRDELGMAKARRLEARMHQYDYRYASSDVALKRALEHARRAGDEAEEMKIYDSYTHSSLWGPVHVDVALARFGDFRERFPGNRMVEASCARGMAMLEAMRGHFAEARSLLARFSELLADLGLGFSATTSLAPGIVEMLAGDVVGAERAFRASYESLGRAGERNIRAAAAAYLARVLYLQGRFDDAYELTRISEELAPEDDFASIIEWASTRAKVLARRGDNREADRLSSEVVRLSSDTDELGARATALLDRAEVLRLIRSDADPTPCVREALGLYARKGDVASAASARRLLGEDAPPLVIDLREEEAARR